MSRRAGIFGLGALLAVACTPEVADDGVSNGGTSGTAATHAGGYAGASLAGAGGAETQAGGGSGGAGSGPSVGGSAGSSGAGGSGLDQGGSGGSDVAGSGGSEHVDQGGAGGSEITPQGGAAGSNQGGTGGSDVVEQDGAGGADVGQGGSDVGEGGSDQGGTGGTVGQPPVCDYQGGTCEGLYYRECDGGEYFEYPCDFNCEDNRGCFGECANGDTRCSSEAAQTCVDGEWTTSEECSGSSTCINGECSDCVPGDTHCNGSTVERCDQNGHWEGSEVCDILCSDGACSGSCQPGTTQCSARELQLCSPYGEWSHAATCPNACVDGSCVGVCVPGSTRCSGTTAQTCSVQGQWQDSESCPFVCSAGACGGECVPGSMVCYEAAAATKTCGASGFYDSPAACPPSLEPASWHLVPTCSEGICGIACEDGYDDCDGNGSCTNQLANDRNNCGICGHSCKGGDCKNGRCQQMVATYAMAGRSNVVDGVVMLDGKLYWGQFGGDNSDDAVIERSGTTTSAIVNAQNRPAHISSYGGRLCWSVLGGSSSGQGDIVCLDGGLPTTVVSLKPGLGSAGQPLHMNGQFAAWSGREASLSTGQVITMSDYSYVAFVSDDYTYWVTRPGGSSTSTTDISRSIHGSTSREVIVEGQENIRALFVSNDDIVWIAGRAPNSGRYSRVFHMSLQTRNMTLLHEAGAFMGADMLTIHDGRIYWMETIPEGAGHYALMRTHVGDTDAVQITDPELTPLYPYGNHLAFDGEFAYWAEYTLIRKVPTTHWTDF